MVGNRCQWRAWKGGMIICRPLSVRQLDRTSDFLLGPLHPACWRGLFLSYPVWPYLRISKSDLYISSDSPLSLISYWRTISVRRGWSSHSCGTTMMPTWWNACYLHELGNVLLQILVNTQQIKVEINMLKVK